MSMDFSESSKNGKASGDAEAAPAEGVDAPHGEAKGECLVCYEDLSVENYCEFQLPESSTWYPAAFCFPCIEILRKSQVGLLLILDFFTPLRVPAFCLGFLHCLSLSRLGTFSSNDTAMESRIRPVRGSSARCFGKGPL